MLMQLRKYHLPSESSVGLLLALMTLYVFGLCSSPSHFVNSLGVKDISATVQIACFGVVASFLTISFVAVNSTVYSIFPILIAVFALIGAAVWWVPLRSLDSRGSRYHV